MIYQILEMDTSFSVKVFMSIRNTRKDNGNWVRVINDISFVYKI